MSAIPSACVTIVSVMHAENTSHDPETVRLVVGAALVDDLVAPTRLLAARRTEPRELAGRWELPGGKVEPGESPLHALHREVCEELGVGIRVGPPVLGPLAGASWPLGGCYEMLVWLAEVTSGAPKPLEDHDELRWLSRAALRGVAWLPPDLPIIDVVAGHLHGPDTRRPRKRD